MTINVTVRMPDKCDYKGRITFWTRANPGDDWAESSEPEKYLIAGETADLAIWDTRGVTIGEHYPISDITPN